MADKYVAPNIEDILKRSEGKAVSILENMREYLSKDALHVIEQKKINTTVLSYVYPMNEGENKWAREIELCQYAGMACADVPTKEDYRTFAYFINDAVAEKVIKYGVMIEPYCLQGDGKYFFKLYFYSRFTGAELQVAITYGLGYHSIKVVPEGGMPDKIHFDTDNLLSKIYKKGMQDAVFLLDKGLNKLNL
jgi:hypothetical protein